MKHNAKSPYFNKINFRILNGFDTLFQVNNVYIINDTITICPNIEDKKYTDRVIHNSNRDNNVYVSILPSDRWTLFNFLGQKVLEGIGAFNLNEGDNRFETGLYFLTRNGEFHKKIFIKKDK